MKIRELPQGLAEKYDMPEEILPGAASVTIFGGRQARIDGCRGILEYSQESLMLAMRKGRLMIRGANLVLKAMNTHELVVSGKILGVEWL